MSERLASLRAALRPHLIPILLLATLLAAAALRFYALDWDRGQFFHPDERAIMEATVKVGLPVPFKLSQLLSPQSPLNPKFFAYGSLPFYLTKATASFLGLFRRSFLEYGNLRLVGRAYSVLFDLGTIVLIYLLGKKLYDRRAGLLAAVFVAFSVLHIQLAHFYAVDGVLTFFIVLAVYLAVDVMRSGSLGRSALLGASVGLALASKFSAAPVLLTVVVAWAIWVVRGPQSVVPGQTDEMPSAVDRLAKAIVGLTIAGLCFLVVFFIGEPYAFIDWPSFIKRILEEGAMARGIADLPYTRQYINTPAYLYQIKNALLVSYGLPLGLAAFAGLAWATVVAIFRRRPGEIVVLSWVLVYFAIDGAFQVKFLRYLLPLLPFLSLFAAQAMLSLRDHFARARTPRYITSPPGEMYRGTPVEAAIVPTSAQPIEVGPMAMPLAPAEPGIELEELPLDWEERLELDPPEPPAPAIALAAAGKGSLRDTLVRAWRGLGGWLNRYGQAIAQALIALVVVSTVFYALAFLNIYRQKHPWIQISEWIYRQVPKGAVRATEHWDDHLPLGLVVDGKGRSEGEYPFKEMPLYEEDNPAKLNLIIERLRSVDYVILATNRLYGSIARLPDRYPITTEYYRLLFEEKLGFKLVSMAATYPSFLGVTFMDDTTVDPPLLEPPLLADFRPSPLVIHLGRVDESFTVYDHPKPLVFQKTQSLSDAELRALFADSLSRWDELNRQKQAQAERKRQAATRGKTLLLDEALRRAQEAGGTFSAIFHRNDLANRLPVLVWWLAVQVLGLLAFPVAFVVFRGLHDRGYVLAKSLGILLVAYPVWLLASLRLMAFGRLAILLFMAVLAIVSGLMARARRQEMADFWRQQWRLILGGEVLFLVAYLAFVGIRVLNPDLWQPWFGGEKPMEFAFLNAITKSTYFPPYDPYYAGGYINYYYYGQYLVAFLIRLTGIVPTVAFNVAVPMLFALTVVNAFSITYNLVRGMSNEAMRGRGNEGTLTAHPSSLITRHSSLIPPSIFALLGALFVAVIGNLTVPIQIGWGLIRNGASTFKSTIPGLEPLVKIGAGLVATYTQHRALPSFDYWDLATRIIPNTINEFPFFSFLFADLHPHMIGIPFTLLVQALALSLVRSPWSSVVNSQTSSVNLWSFVLRPSSLICLAVSLGSLVAINSWDLPTYLGIVFCALLIQQWAAERRLGLVALLTLLVRFGVIVALSLLLYLPFFQSYQALFVGLGLVRGRTPLLYYLAIHGFFIVILTTFLLVEARREGRNALLRLGRLLWRRWDALPRLLSLARRLVRPTATFHLALWGLVGLLVLVLLFIVLRLTIFVLLVPLLILTVVLAFRRQATAEELFTLLLLFTGLLLSLGVEFFFLRDFLAGGDVYRMNTIFKFYIQIWIFFALASAVGLSRIAESLPLPLPLPYQGRGEDPSLPLPYQGRGEGRGWRIAWLGVFAFLLVAVLLYPVLGIPARVNQRFPGARPPVGTLDGAAFMSVGSYTFDWQGRQFKVDLSYDYEAIRWLQDNVQGSPVIAEARVDYYREFGMRVSSFTGLPTLLGAHQGEQRYDTQVGQRDGEARTFFNEPSFEKVLPLIGQLHIKYIYVGQLERDVYNPQGLAKFDAAVGQYLDLVYENPKVKIYRLK